jgi:hypothetical protein
VGGLGKHEVAIELGPMQRPVQPAGAGRLRTERGLEVALVSFYC